MKGADIVRTAQEKFDVAREHYQKAMQHIETITTICEKAAKGTDLFLKNQFDVILQTALLKLATQDGHFSHTERQFIEQIVDNGDVLDFVNQKYGTELTWDGIEVSSVEEIDEFWDKLLDVIQNLMNEFFRRVFLVNEAISPEFWKGVINAVTSICEIFAVLDDDAMVEEDVIQKWVYAFFMLPLDTLKDKMEQHRHSIAGNLGKLNDNSV